MLLKIAVPTAGSYPIVFLSADITMPGQNSVTDEVKLREML